MIRRNHLEKGSFLVNQYVMLVKSMRLIFIFTILYCFSLLGFAASQYQYVDRYLFQSRTERALSNQEHWLIKFGLSPNNKEIYAIDSIKKLLTIVDVTTGTTLKKIPLPTTKEYDTAFGVVFSHDGKKAYFSTMLKNVYIIDTVKQEIIGKVANKPETNWVYTSTGLCMTPDGRRLYAIDSIGEKKSTDNLPRIHVIDTQTDSVIDTIKKQHVNDDLFGWFDSALAFSKDTNLLYFTDMFSGSVSILNIRDNTLEDEAIKYDSNDILGIAIDEKNNKLYVLSGSGTIIISNLVTRQKIDEISIGTDTLDFALVENGKKLYVTDRATDSVSVLDVTQKIKLIKKISVGKKPQTLRVSSDDSKLYVGNAGSNDISVIDIVTDNVVRIITVNN